MSRDIATIILRTVSAWALSPYLTLSSFVTPSTSIATSSPNSRRQLLERVVGVFDRVVQERRRDRARSEAEIREDLRDGERMRDVRLAALTRLAGVGALGDGVGALDDRQVALGMVRAHRPQELLDVIAARRPREDPRNETAKRRGLRGQGGTVSVIRSSPLRWIRQSYARAEGGLRPGRPPARAPRGRARRAP